MKFSATFIFAIAYATQALALPTGDGQLVEQSTRQSTYTPPVHTYIPPSPPANTYIPPAHTYLPPAGERDNAAKALGYKSEGVAAYIYQKQICGSVPLYRLHSPAATDHFYTISKSEADNAASKLGYANEGVAGYVLPPH